MRTINLNFYSSIKTVGASKTGRFGGVRVGVAHCKKQTCAAQESLVLTASDGYQSSDRLQRR